MEKLCQSSAVRRLLLLGICIVFTVVLCKDPVFADANYKIKLNAAVENAVFTLTYTGEVDGLTIISPAGVSYDTSTCGTAYRKESGKIRIGILYADPGLWQIVIAGSPDDGFRLLVISDSGYGEYAGKGSVREENPVPSETAIPPATAGSAASSAPQTESVVTETVPEQTETASVGSDVRIESKTNTGTVVTSAIASEKGLSGEDSHKDETISERMTSGSDSPGDMELYEATHMTGESFRESETVVESELQIITGTPVLAVDNGGMSQEPSPVPGAGSGGTGNADGAVLFTAAAVTLSVIVFTIGKMLRGTAGESPDQVRPQKKDKGEERINFRDYFPEEK